MKDNMNFYILIICIIICFLVDISIFNAVKLEL